MFRAAFLFCFVTAVMVAAWFGMRFLIAGISGQFGAGVLVGMFIVWLLWFVNDRIERGRSRHPY